MSKISKIAGQKVIWIENFSMERNDNLQWTHYSLQFKLKIKSNLVSKLLIYILYSLKAFLFNKTKKEIYGHLSERWGQKNENPNIWRIFVGCFRIMYKRESGLKKSYWKPYRSVLNKQQDFDFSGTIIFFLEYWNSW